LFDLLGVKPERAICTPASGHVFVAQLRRDMPSAVGNLLWFAYGPADTSCFVPLYAGVADLPNAWDHPANFTRIDRAQPQWNFRLVHNLTQRLPYQRAIKDVRAMIRPAEQRYIELQARLEQTASSILLSQGPEAAESFLTAYACECAKQVGSAYSELVDYLLLRYLVGDPEFAPPTLPRIAVPTLPGASP
jgi:dipeptidase